jgi:hypothetical protein
MGVHETGRDEQSAGIDLFPSTPGYGAYLHDTAFTNGDIGRVRFLPAAVYDQSTAYDEIVLKAHGVLPGRLSWRPAGHIRMESPCASQN